MDLFVCEKWVVRGSVDSSEAWKVSGGWLVGCWSQRRTGYARYPLRQVGKSVLGA